MKNPNEVKLSVKNDNDFVINQHYSLPSSVIKNFKNSAGKVHFFYKYYDQVALFKEPRDKEFCIRRAWDQTNEDQMANIEENFSKIAQNIISGKITKFDDVTRHRISEMSAMLVSRFNVAQKEIHERSSIIYDLSGYSSRKELEQQELNDRKSNKNLANKVVTINPNEDGSIDSHLLKGWFYSQAYSHYFFYELKNEKEEWQIFKISNDREFIVPDKLPLGLIIISPKIALYSSRLLTLFFGLSQNCLVDTINIWSKDNCVEFYFCHDPSKC